MEMVWHLYGGGGGGMVILWLLYGIGMVVVWWCHRLVECSGS